MGGVHSPSIFSDGPIRCQCESFRAKLANLVAEIYPKIHLGLSIHYVHIMHAVVGTTPTT